ncbi:unknown protein [Microcystis aeruginosa NIES-843]|uniref:Uncharacterized protein n=1 Tax=Microcystis aeruginosa (strain NIES-843 / IAM M-2473) TaxID=449447 RepID=B0JVH6_MICAN|nr:unknown protein [Microcystis aeruginosa NIES-843]
MRNVNLNILKFLESINNFYLSLSNIGLGVRNQEIGGSLLARCGGFWGDRVMRQLPHFPTSPLHNS